MTATVIVLNEDMYRNLGIVLWEEYNYVQPLRRLFLADRKMRLEITSTEDLVDFAKFALASVISMRGTEEKSKQKVETLNNE